MSLSNLPAVASLAQTGAVGASPASSSNTHHPFVATSSHPTALPPSAASTPLRALDSGLNSSSAQTVIAPRRPPASAKSIEEEVKELEAALERLRKLGLIFYDCVEGQLGPEADSRATQESLRALLEHLSIMMATASKSTLGGIPIGSNSSESGSLDERIISLRSQGNEAYEKRQRLREASGAVAHVLAAGGLGVGAVVRATTE